jgi:hypothetical protein
MTESLEMPRFGAHPPEEGIDGFRLFRPPPPRLLSFSADVRLQKGRGILSGRKAAKARAAGSCHRLAAVARERAHMAVRWPCMGESIGDGGMEWAARRCASGGGPPRGCAWLDWRSFQEAELERRFVAMDGAGPPWRRMPSPGRLLGGGLKDGYKGGLFAPGRREGREGARSGGRKGAQSGAGTKRARGIRAAPLASFSLALRLAHDEFVCASGSWG